MKICKILGIVTLLLLSQSALAVPTFQTYIVGATAGDYNGDQDSWFTTDSSFNLIVVGAYGPKTLEPLSEVTLLLSVPQGETGTITISGGATLLHTKTEIDGTGVFNPNADADIDLLGGNGINPDGYQTKNFIPDDAAFNNHYPMQNDVSDFLIYGIGDFYDIGTVHNYNADDGSITEAGHGEEKVFEVSITGFSRVHIDAYGLETTTACKQLKTTWDINPGSHDATYIPAPGAILLGSIGIGIVGWLRRRKTL